MCLILVWVGLSAIPGMSADRGVFASVAERLVAGQTLYAEVWDNKDPLFFYTLAAAHLVHPALDYVVELMWLTIASVGCLLVARARDLPVRTSLMLACLVPLILVGGAAPAGYTHLPGTAMGLLGLGAILRGRVRAAGFVTGVVGLLKITTFPVMGLMMLVVLVRRRSVPDVIRWASAGLAGVALVIAVLVVRGELIPWFDAMFANVGYSTNGGGPVQKLGRVFEDPSTWSVAIVLCLLIALGRMKQDLSAADRTLRVAGEVSALGGVVVLAVAGLWPHHVQVLMLASALLLILITPPDPGPGVVALLVAAAILAGGVSPAKALGNLRRPWERLSALSTPPPPSRELGGIDDVRYYARLGGNDDAGHALGLRHLEMKCPVFHQYATDSHEKLQGTADCIRRADAVLVGRFLAKQSGQETWNAFVDRSEATLRDDFKCSTVGRDRLCIRVATRP